MGYTTGVQFPVGCGIFLLSTASTGSGAHTGSYPWDTGGFLSQGVKLAIPSI